MIVGVGVDLADVARFEAMDATQRGRFAARCFTDAERAYLDGRGAAWAQSAAGLFAAKEAALKAMGEGLGACAFTDLEILHDAKRKPSLRFRGEAEGLARRLGVRRAHVSVSHDGGVAAAVAVLEE